MRGQWWPYIGAEPLPATSSRVCDDPRPMIVVVRGEASLIECPSCGFEVRVGSEVESIAELAAVGAEHRETGL